MSFENPTKYAFAFDYKVDDQKPVVDKWAEVLHDDGVYTVVDVAQADGVVTKTVTFAEDSGDHEVSYRLARGAEQDWYLPWVTVTVHSDCLPPTVKPCSPSPLPVLAVTDKDLRGLSFEVLSKGHYNFIKLGLHIWTTDSSKDAKVKGMFPTATPLIDAGDPVLNFLNSGKAAEPGYNLRITAPGLNGTPLVDGKPKPVTLVHEPGWAPGLWWSDYDVLHDGVYAGGSRVFKGTLNDLLVAHPDAVVTEFGFSLGASAKGQGVLRSLTFGCANYVFGKATGAPIPPAPPAAGTVPVLPGPAVSAPAPVAEIAPAPTSTEVAVLGTKIAKAGATATGSGEQLAKTGSNVGSLAVAGVLLLGLGVTALAAGRRRHVGKHI